MRYKIFALILLAVLLLLIFSGLNRKGFKQTLQYGDKSYVEGYRVSVFASEYRNLRLRLDEIDPRFRGRLRVGILGETLDIDAVDLSKLDGIGGISRDSGGVVRRLIDARNGTIVMDFRDDGRLVAFSVYFNGHSSSVGANGVVEIFSGEEVLRSPTNYAHIVKLFGKPKNSTWSYSPGL